MEKNKENRKKDLKKDVEEKDYPGIELKREKTKNNINEDSFFFEFLFGNAEKGTYDIGCMGKGKKKNQLVGWLRNKKLREKEYFRY